MCSAAGALAALGCGAGSESPASGASASATATTVTATSGPAPPCTPRTAEKLGLPFVRVCPPGEPGFWIGATPMACSGGDHDAMRCPTVTAIGHPVSTSPLPIRPTTAQLIDAETAARVCFYRMGGHVASRAERVKARHGLGLATVLVTESDSAAQRFRFAELPEWVSEEPGERCENQEPMKTCHFGWYPAESRSPGVPWANMRACQAVFHAVPPADLPLVALGSGCAAPTWSWAEAPGSERPLPCGLHTPAGHAPGTRGDAAFALACRAPALHPHPVGEDKNTAAYRCVLPASALGAYDLPGR